MPLDLEMPVYLDCQDVCDCGCECDGEWHFEGSIGCMCLSRGCACVRDRAGYGVGV